METKRKFRLVLSDITTDAEVVYIWEGTLDQYPTKRINNIKDIMQNIQTLHDLELDI